MFIFISGFGFGLVILGVPPYTDLVLPAAMFAIALGGLYMIYQQLSKRVRSARFYENEFRVSGKSFKKTFNYRDIEDVIFVKGGMGPDSITIAVKNGEDPIVIFSNPRNLLLGMKLYTWLMKKKVSVSDQCESGHEN